jgi:O-antigen ligase/tetratricopeptide (TPR) repeat protein
MKISSISTSWFFIILLSLTQFIPDLGAIDIVGPQLLYLSIITLLSSIYLFYGYNYKKQYSNKSNILNVYFVFVFFCLLSVIGSFNKTEGIITFFKLLLMGLYIFNLSYHFVRVKIKFSQLSIIFSILIFFDLINLLNSFVSIYDFNRPPGRSDLLTGYTSNLNVLGFSLLFRIPFIIFFIYNSKHWKYVLLSISLFSLTIFFIIASGSRGAILSLILLLFFFLIYQFAYNKNKNSTVLITAVSIFTFLGHTFLFQNGNDVTQRLETLSVEKINEDKSSEQRIRWILAGLEGIAEKPITGHGIGNWKIVGNKYVTDYIERYTIPKHAHNDFIQTFAEVGIFGFLSFILFFLLLFLKVLNLKNLNPDFKFGTSVLLFSVAAYMIDSNLNFPLERPTSMFNIFTVVAYVISLNPPEKRDDKYKGVRSFLLIIGALITAYSSYRVYVGLVDEVEFFNRIGHQRGFETPLEKIDDLNDSYPNITYTTIPIITIKGIYYWKNNKISEAKEMLNAGNKINPYLFVSEANLSNIYLEEGKSDSAYFYAKKAFYKLKKNERHANLFQMALLKKNNMVELDSVFDITRDFKYELIYQNHLNIISYMKINDGFSERDKEISSEGRRLFPKNKIISRAFKIIQNGGELITSANIFDAEAKLLFSKKKYIQAIEKWNLAKNILPVESSYYLNIAQSQILLGNFDSSYVELDSIESLEINKGDGKLEFLRAMNDISTNKKSMACKNLMMAYRMGKVKETLPVIRQLKCQSL